MSTLPDTVRAVTFTALEVATLVASPRDPKPLDPDEVAGPTLASLTSPGTELEGAYLGKRFPAYPGYAAVFQVAQLGAEVTDLKVGDLVYAMGKHSSWQRQKRAMVVPVPAGLPAHHAVFARLMGVSMSTLYTTKARPGEKVVVSGLGPVGHLAAQQLHACGYQVAGIDPVASRRDLLAAQGIPAVFASAPSEDPAWKDQVAMVVECSGHEAAVLAACKLVRKGGEVVMIGVPWRKRADLQAFDLLHAVFHRYVHLRSGWEWELPMHPQPFVSGSIFGSFRTALQSLATGRVKVADLAELRHPSECQAVYQGLLHQTLQRPCVVFDWTQA